MPALTYAWPEQHFFGGNIDQHAAVFRFLRHAEACVALKIQNVVFGKIGVNSLCLGGRVAVHRRTRARAGEHALFVFKREGQLFDHVREREMPNIDDKHIRQRAGERPKLLFIIYTERCTPRIAFFANDRYVRISVLRKPTLQQLCDVKLILIRKNRV